MLFRSVYGLSLGGFVLKPDLAENNRIEAEQGARSAAMSSSTPKAPLNVGGAGSINVDPTNTDADKTDEVVAGDLTLRQTFDWVKTLTHIAEKPRYGVDVTIEDDQHKIFSGGATNYHLQVTNTGNVPDKIKLELGGRD